jgi:hypothetical protein
VFVAWREQPVVLQHAAQVFDVTARPGGIEAGVRERYCARGDSTEQLQHLNIALPGEDAFGPVDSAQHFEHGFHGGWIGGMVQQDGAQVVAQGAAGAFAAAVDFAFVSAGSTRVVAGNARSCHADRPRIGAVEAAGQDTVVPAVRADAVGAHRGVEAAVAELVTGPVDPQLVGSALASAAFVVACGDWWPSAACGSWLGANWCHR